MNVFYRDTVGWLAVATLMQAPLAAHAQQQPAVIPAAIDVAQAASELTAGDFVWSEAAAPTGAVSIVISLSDQIAYVYRGERLIAASSVSTGSPGRDTPTGAFTILQKAVKHKSNKYEDAPMPYMQRLTWDGIAIHAGRNPGYAASHGCIRVPMAFARKLYGATRLGVAVTVTDDTVDAAAPMPVAPPEAIPTMVPPVSADAVQ